MAVIFVVLVCVVRRTGLPPRKTTVSVGVGLLHCRLAHSRSVLLFQRVCNMMMRDIAVLIEEAGTDDLEKRGPVT